MLPRELMCSACGTARIVNTADGRRVRSPSAMAEAIMELVRAR
jgi:hypothetical protein